ncbi:hypothetical protein BuS5_03719 [Desulfosarcina sp. BuS5]|uniref:GtrA family protein n=1 Tax=Desulfosarcina sp. BuS5 TaxID=933262 RepID=UPI00047F61D5|nr:GtrA family protein [Desulfosarcina sp. BuS5]WDN90748.1 hypothetical protein BuS5_03719 [Desulfosarcina sp. BuS5]
MNQHALEVLKYVINGVVATLIHFGVLSFCLKVVGVPSAGFANLIAAIFGITASFIGSRYFVFPVTGETVASQLLKFSGLYGGIAILHGFVLLIWSDWFGFDYRAGFLIATALQVSLSYIGNKFFVFRMSA